MSSTKRRLDRNSLSISTSLFAQFSLLNVLSSVAVNSLGEMVSPCLTPLLILIFSPSLCRCIHSYKLIVRIRSVAYSGYTPQPYGGQQQFDGQQYGGQQPQGGAPPQYGGHIPSSPTPQGTPLSPTPSTEPIYPNLPSSPDYGPKRT